MHIPEGALVSGSGDIAIRAMVTGKFQYPEGTEPVSAVYGIFTSATFAEPVTVEIQHCVALKKEEDCCFLSFAFAHDQHHPPLCFRKLEGGSFSPDSQYGVISCSSFCYLMILKFLFPNVFLPENDDTAEPIGASQPGKMWVWKVSPVMYCTILYCSCCRYRITSEPIHHDEVS